MQLLINLTMDSRLRGNDENLRCERSTLSKKLLRTCLGPFAHFEESPDCPDLLGRPRDRFGHAAWLFPGQEGYN